MIVIDCKEFEKKLRMYFMHGISKNTTERYKTGLPFYDILHPGFKSNMSDIQAALGVVQAKKLPKIDRLRNQVAAWYDEYLQDVDDITLPVIRKYNHSARHLYPILLNQRLKPFRDEIIIELRKQGIYPSVHFIPVHFHSFFRNFFNKEIKLPVTEDIFY